MEACSVKGVLLLEINSLLNRRVGNTSHEINEARARVDTGGE